MDNVNFAGCFKPRRELGRTGFRASALGIGDVADRGVPLQECVATVRRAMEAGLNVIDTAPGYEDGYSEEIVGTALRHCRDGMFVIDKIDYPEQPVAPQVEESLKRLNMDFTDAFVLHGVSDLSLWDRASGVGGAMEQLEKCRQQGKLRFRGISSHHPDVLDAAIQSGSCDIVLFPVGPGCDIRYVEQVLPLAKKKGVATVCFKTFGAGKLLGDTEGYSRPLQTRPRGKISSGGERAEQATAHVLPHMDAADCVWYTLTCDPDVALLGLSFPNEQDAAFRAALDFRPLSSERMTELRRDAAQALEGKGACWWNP